MKARPALALLVLAGVLAGSSTAAQAQAWAPEQVVVSKETRVSTPNVEVGVGGYAVVVWAKVPRSKLVLLRGGSGVPNHRLQLAVRPSAGQPFGSPMTVYPDLPRQFQFGMSEAGESFIAWIDRERDLLLTRFAANAAPLPPTRLARDVTEMYLTVAEDGTAVIAYRHRGKARLLQRTAMPGAGFAPAQTVRRNGPRHGVALDAGPDGRAVLAWEDGASRVRAAQMLGGAGFGPAQRVPGARFPNSTIEVAAAVDESFVLVNGRLDSIKLLIGVAPAGGAFRRVRPLRTSGSRSGEFGVIDVDGAGSATVLWDRFSRNGRAAGTEISTRPAGGTWATPRPLARGRDGGEIVLSVASDGGGAASWNTGEPAVSIRAAVRPPGASFAAPEPVGSVTARNTYVPSDVAMGPGGYAVAVWSAPDKRLDLHGVFAAQAVLPPGGD